MSKVVIHKRAARYLKRFPRSDQDRIKEALRHLSIDQLRYPGVIAMAGEWSGYYRIRVGDYRIIFFFDKMRDVFFIDHIGPRGDIYKRQ